MNARFSMTHLLILLLAMLLSIHTAAAPSMCPPGCSFCSYGCSCSCPSPEFSALAAAATGIGVAGIAYLVHRRLRKQQ